MSKKFPAVLYVHRETSGNEKYLVADENLSAHADLHSEEHIAAYKLIDEMTIRAVIETRPLRKGKSK